MKIHTLGTCSGTEPMPTRQHAACVFEINGKYYWFDAGCGCSRTAHLTGMDLLKADKIFISHRHRDHTAGLPELFWNIKKLTWLQQIKNPAKIELYLPEMFIWDCVNSMLQLEWGGITVEPHVFGEGTVYEDSNIKVEARHNYHLEPEGSEHYTSYTFRITAEGKQIIYSGDVKHYSDMGDYLDNCDLLMMETGHHKASEVCAGIKADGFGVKEIMFVHSGREILNDYEGAKERAGKAWGKPVIIAEDGNTYEI